MLGELLADLAARRWCFLESLGAPGVCVSKSLDFSLLTFMSWMILSKVWPPLSVALRPNCWARAARLRCRSTESVVVVVVVVVLVVVLVVVGEVGCLAGESAPIWLGFVRAATVWRLFFLPHVEEVDEELEEDFLELAVVPEEEEVEEEGDIIEFWRCFFFLGMRPFKDGGRDEEN
jgi:hypothetical protein